MMFSAMIAGLRLTNWLNWIVAAILMAFLAVLLSDAGGFRSELLARFDEPVRDPIRDFLYAVLALTPPVTAAVHILLTRLTALVGDAARGLAFTDANAARLRMMGWALLAINMVDIAYGWLSVRASAETGEYFGWSFSLTGWIAVPMLFVLAHVFREGTAMREDLEGTV